MHKKPNEENMQERAREREREGWEWKKSYFHINKIQFRMDLIELYLINF